MPGEKKYVIYEKHNNKAKTEHLIPQRRGGRGGLPILPKRKRAIYFVTLFRARNHFPWSLLIVRPKYHTLLKVRNKENDIKYKQVNSYRCLFWSQKVLSNYITHCSKLPVQKDTLLRILNSKIVDVVVQFCSWHQFFFVLVQLFLNWFKIIGPVQNLSNWSH